MHPFESAAVGQIPARSSGEERRSFAPEGMTDRQVECLAWVQEGKSATDIGTILGISPRTVVQMQRRDGRFRITEVWYEPFRKRALAA